MSSKLFCHTVAAKLAALFFDTSGFAAWQIFWFDFLYPEKLFLFWIKEHGSNIFRQTNCCILYTEILFAQIPINFKKAVVFNADICVAEPCITTCVFMTFFVFPNAYKNLNASRQINLRWFVYSQYIDFLLSRHF